MKLSRRLPSILALVLAGPVLATACGSSGSAKAAPACDSSQLRLSMTLQGATGNLVGAAGFTNTGKSACTLTGTPKVTIGVPGGRELSVVQKSWKPVWQQDAAPKPAGWPLVELTPSSMASVALKLAGWCGRYGPKASFSFALPGDGGAMSAEIAVSGSCPAPSGKVSVLVGPFEPDTALTK